MSSDVHDPPPAIRRGALWRVAIVVVWAALVGGGTLALAQYKERAGRPAESGPTWPAESALARVPGRPTLVMLAHPRCPCTRASLTELARLMSRIEGRVTAHVVFVRPEATDDAWERTALWLQASATPSLTLLEDRGGVEAARFGAFTSGQVLLFGADGTLQFRGGLTTARGHEGKSPAEDRIVELVGGGAGDFAESPVFGCALLDPERAEER